MVLFVSGYFAKSKVLLFPKVDRHGYSSGTGKCESGVKSLAQKAVEYSITRHKKKSLTKYSIAKTIYFFTDDYYNYISRSILSSINEQSYFRARQQSTIVVIEYTIVYGRIF